MTWTSLENFFTPTITPEIAAEWRDRPVVTGADAFKPVALEDFRNVARTLCLLLPHEINSGSENAVWARDRAGRLTVVKNGNPEGRITGGREKLFSDLGRAIACRFLPRAYGGGMRASLMIIAWRRCGPSPTREIVRPTKFFLPIVRSRKFQFSTNGSYAATGIEGRLFMIPPLAPPRPISISVLHAWMEAMRHSASFPIGRAGA
ncbi:MAG: hypothetical protein WDO70_09335 [Alphaproteobacteria bacterium]